MRRTIIAPMVLAVLLVTAGCLGGGTTPAQTTETTMNDTDTATAAEADSGSLIRVSGTGELDTEPDQAVIRVAVTASGDSAAAVREAIAANASKMRTALVETGLDSSQIVTSDYDIRNQERYRGDEQPPYFGRHAFTITISDIDATGDVVVTAVENGATDINDVRFTLSRETEQELRKDALSDAMTNARTEADILASGAGLEITGVDTVQSVDTHYTPVRMETASLAAGDGGVSTRIDGGTVTVTADVVVTYNATDA